MAIHDDESAALEQATVIGADGGKLGTVDGVYYDNDTDSPSWAAVKSGLFGHDVALVPLAAASVHGDELHIPFDGEQLRSAPHHEPGRDLSPQDEMDLFRHYGVPYGTPADPGPGTETAPGAGDHTAASGSADEGMTRSEERLRVHTESQPVERVRLRKRIVTEYRQVTVPVRREEIVVERVPAGEAGDADLDDTATVGAGPVGGSATGYADPDAAVPAGDDEQEIILYAERPVVSTETVAVERIRVGKRTVTEDQTVGGEVRREEIELDTDPGVADPR